MKRDIFTTNPDPRSREEADWKQFRALSMRNLRANEDSLAILRRVYFRRGVTKEDKLRHRDTILAVLHRVHVTWERVWDHDLRVHEASEGDDYIDEDYPAY